MKKNKLKLLSGLLLIILIILGWLALIVINNWQAGGGAILVVLFFTVISWIWKNMVIQKVVVTDDNPNSINLMSYQNIEIQNLEPSLQNTTKSKPTNQSYFRLIWSLLNFKLAFHKEIINEGNRRLLIILSLFLPFLLSMLYCKVETEGDYYIGHESFYIAFVLLYIIFHIGLRIYKWIFDGYKINN